MKNGFWTNRSVFVTGHTGFKGAWLCLWLKRLGARVSGYALNPPTMPSLFAETALEKRIDSSVFGEIRDFKKLQISLAEAHADVVFHLAAQPLVRESYRDPVGTYSTNVMGTVHVLEATRNAPTVRAVVIVTTDKVYENREWLWGYREDERLGGYDPYSNSKACTELVVASYRDSFFNTKDYDKHRVSIATARSGNVIGGGDWARDRLVPDCIRAFQKHEEVCIRYPNSTRPWQHVLEPLEGYLSLARHLIESGPSFSGAWNFGPARDNAEPVASLVDRLVRLWGNGASYRIDAEANPHEAGHLYLDNTKATSLLAWKPRLSINTALELTVSWFKDYYLGEDPYGICRSQLEDYGDML